MVMLFLPRSPSLSVKAFDYRGFALFLIAYSAQSWWPARVFSKETGPIGPGSSAPFWSASY